MWLDCRNYFHIANVWFSNWMFSSVEYRLSINYYAGKLNWGSKFWGSEPDFSPTYLICHFEGWGWRIQMVDLLNFLVLRVWQPGEISLDNGSVVGLWAILQFASLTRLPSNPRVTSMSTSCRKISGYSTNFSFWGSAKFWTYLLTPFWGVRVRPPENGLTYFLPQFSLPA